MCGAAFLRYNMPHLLWEIYRSLQHATAVSLQHAHRQTEVVSVLRFARYGAGDSRDDAWSYTHAQSNPSHSQAAGELTWQPKRGRLGAFLCMATSSSLQSL
jgi:hypothetical protein